MQKVKIRQNVHAIENIEKSYLWPKINSGGHFEVIWLCDLVGKIHSSDGNTFSRFQLRYPYRTSQQFSPDFIMEQLP